MRWLKRIGLTLVVLTLLAALCVLWVWRQAAAVPDWYTQAAVGPAATAEQPLFPIQNWAARATAGDVDAKPEAAKQHTMELTDAQINALLVKWSEAAGVSAKMDQQFQNVRVRLDDNKITIAGRAVEYDRVMSIVLEPVKKEGRVKLSLLGIWSGDQRLPMVALSKQQSQLQGGIARRADAAREKVSIDSRGVASAKTVELYYTTLLGELFAGRQPDAMAFLNYNVLQDQTDAVATRVTDMTIDDGKIRMEIRLLSPDERTALVDYLRAYGKPAETAAN